MDPVIGNTHAYVAVLETHGASIVPCPDGSPGMPAWVAMSDNGRCLVGEPALHLAATSAHHAVFGATRLLGVRGSSRTARELLSRVPYALARNREDSVMIQLPGWTTTPQEVCSRLLNEQRRRAEQYLEARIRTATLAVPLGFQPPQIAALTHAARTAQLAEVRTVDRPTAALHAARLTEAVGQHAAVVHLGGGTFEISLHRLGADGPQLLAHENHPFLGGDQLDSRLLDLLVGRCLEQHGVDLRGQPGLLHALRVRAQQAKRELDRSPTAEIQLPLAATAGGAGRDLALTLQRDEVARLLLPTLQRVRQLCCQALQRAQLSPQQVELVLPIGGMTRMPHVRAALSQLFGRELHTGVAPEAAAALGACLETQAVSPVALVF